MLRLLAARSTVASATAAAASASRVRTSALGSQLVGLGSDDQERGYATLSDMKARLGALGNMQKITSSMKMVAAAKLRRVEVLLKDAETFGESSKQVAAKVMKEIEVEPKKHLLIGVTSDRGLCGGINSQIVKKVRLQADQNEVNDVETKVVMIGEKGRLAMLRLHGHLYEATFNDFGRGNFSYAQASRIAADIMDIDFDVATIYYNKFQSAISFVPTAYDMLSPSALEELGKDVLSEFEDEGDKDIYTNMQHAFFANQIYAAMIQNSTSEQASRMQAMESASSNAGDMIDSLQLVYNRQRQAVITRELIEIISGASALDG